MISSNDFKNGMTIEYEGDLLEIIYFQHVKPGKGGAFVRTKLKNLINNTIFEKTFRAGEKIEQAILETKKMQFLYKDDHYNFMDNETYEQLSIDESHIGDKKQYLIENMEITMIFYKGNPISVELPTFIEAEVINTEPGIKGDTVSNTFKPVEIITGAKVNAPLFIKNGDTIRIDTRTGEYITRV
ncbi:MAG TPA: elongation factor P [Actinobacteria bacterium]|jgi:elongation factor P|nr:elongation factor P [Actinomycetota bacterium]